MMAHLMQEHVRNMVTWICADQIIVNNTSITVLAIGPRLVQRVVAILA